jgi:hypothetical protein
MQPYLTHRVVQMQRLFFAEEFGFISLLQTLYSRRSLRTKWQLQTDNDAIRDGPWPMQAESRMRRSPDEEERPSCSFSPELEHVIRGGVLQKSPLLTGSE